jgi:hypothetical protein
LGYLRLDYHLLTVSATLTFPSLSVLSLRETVMSIEVASVLFAPTALPSLKALAYTASEATTDNKSIVLLLLEAFARRLEVLQLHLEDDLLMRGLTLPDLPSLIVTTERGTFGAHESGLHSLKPSTLRIFIKEGATFTQATDFALKVHASVDCSSLRRLYLPLILRPPALPSASPSTLTRIPRFLEDLSAQGIAIHWYDSSAEEEYTVSPSFWRDACERKAEKARGREGKA